MADMADETGEVAKAAAGCPVEACPTDANIGTTSLIYNAFHGLKPHVVDGDTAEKGKSTVKRDLPNVATTIEVIGKTEPESAAENAIHKAELDEVIGPCETTTTELKDKIKAFLVYTAIEDGNPTCIHNPFAGGYAAAENG